MYPKSQNMLDDMKTNLKFIVNGIAVAFYIAFIRFAIKISHGVKVSEAANVFTTAAIAGIIAAVIAIIVLTICSWLTWRHIEHVSIERKERTDYDASMSIIKMTKTVNSHMIMHDIQEEEY